MSAGQYRCEPCNMSFNSQEELDEHNQEEHS
ncbi:MAG: hypothetical protein AB7U98_00205 [Candidatus Nitrosocosmicus sp.]